MNYRKKAFTLIELLVVITIIAILAGAAIPYVQQYVEDARYSKAKTNLDEIKNALIRYENDNGKPYTDTTINTLVGPYLMKALVDPWGGTYKVNNASSTCYTVGPDGVDYSGDEIKVDFRPPLALSKAYWQDSNQDGAVSIDDTLIFKVTRPVDKGVASATTDILYVAQEDGNYAEVADGILSVNTNGNEIRCFLKNTIGTGTLVPGKSNVLLLPVFTDPNGTSIKQVPILIKAR